MSNTEFVMVSREPTAEMLEAAKKSGVIDPRVSGYCFELMVAAAPKHQGEPVALECWSCKAEFTLKDRSDCDGCCWKCGVEIDLEDYAGKFAGEVERLRADLDECDGDRWKLRTERNTMRAQLAERDALLGDLKGKTILSWADKHRIDAALSASAEPGAPKCETCKGIGMVDDGEITGVGGVEFENGPVKCVKDCPDCKPSAPVERDEREDFEVCFDRMLKEQEAGLEHYQVSTMRFSKEVMWEGWKARAALERKP